MPTKTTMNNNKPQGSTPVPDPTVLTTQQLTREIAASREIIETRLDGMDMATRLNKEAMDKFPLLMEVKIKNLDALVQEKFVGMEEKFHSIDVQFKERDTRTEQTRTSDKVAVDAALQAQKEAAGAQNESNTAANAKTEQNFTKQLDQIGELITTRYDALDARITEIKGRLDRGEGQKVQQTENKGQQNWFIGLFIIGGLSLVSIIVSVVAILSHLPK